MAKHVNRGRVTTLSTGRLIGKCNVNSRKCLAAVCEALSPALIMDYKRSRDNLAEDGEPDISTDSINSGSDSATARSVEIEQPSAFSTDEKRLRSWWASVLHRPEHLFVRNDNFFSCGGDATAVLHLSRIASVVNIGLRGADIHAHPTLSQMAKFIRSCRTISTAEDTISPLGNYIEDVTPASHTQLAFLIEGQKWCQSYYAWVLIQIEYSAPVAKVQEVFQVVAERHPILQTVKR